MRRFYKKFIYLLCLFWAVIASLDTNAQALDESFETGQSNYSQIGGTWTTSNTYSWYAGNGAMSNGREAKTGTWYAYMGYYKQVWMFHELSLTAGKTYDFSLWSQASATGATLTIKVGTAANAASMTDELLAATEPGSTWTELKGTYTAPTTGTYYIGIYGDTYTLSYGNYITVDDITVAEALANDVSVESLTLSDNMPSASDIITLTSIIKNRGTNDQSNLDVTFKVDGSTVSTQQIATLTSGSSETLTYDYTVVGSGVLPVNVSVATDDNDANNEANENIYILGANNYKEGFEGITEMPSGWDGDLSKWSINTSATYVAEGSNSAKFYNSGVYTDARLVTPKLTFNSDGFVSYYARGDYYVNTIQIQYSTDKITWNNIGDLIALTDNYTQYVIDLTSLNGEYYLSFTSNTQSTSSWAGNTIYLDNVVLPEKYVSADPEIAISPVSYDFGSVGQGAAASTTITLSNPGGADLTVTGVSVASPFSATWSGNIASGGSQDITIALNTTTAGSYSETLTITSNAVSGTNTIDISADVVAPLTYPLSEGFNGSAPTNWKLGGWYLVTTPYEGTHSITTWSASDAMSTPWIDLTGTAPQMAMYWKNSASKNLIIEITEDGTTYTELFNSAPNTADWEELVVDLETYVNKSVQIRFTSDANQSYSSTYIDDLKIEEKPTDPIYTFNQTEFAFGTVLLAETATISGSVTNSGVSTVDIASVTISGADASEFDITALTLPVSIGSTGSLDFDVTYTPTVEGAKTATLTIEESDGTTHDYTITGNGFDAEIKTLPFTENFDATTVGEIPAGWDSFIKTTAAAAVVETAALNANSGSNSLKMYGAYSVDSSMIILPITSIDISTTILNFSLYSTSSGEIVIGYVTDKSGLDTFTKIEGIDYFAYSRKECEVKLSNVDLSGSYYLVILNPSNGNAVYIDDINWDTDATAPVATIFPADAEVDINPYENIVISFDEIVYENGGSVIQNSDLSSMIVLKETDNSGVDVAFTATFDTNTVTITPDTRFTFDGTYYIALVADAVEDAAGNFNQLATSTFTIQTDPSVTTPFTESFEDVTFVPPGWTENRTKWNQYTGTEIDYPHGLASAYYYAGGFDNADSAEMLTPVINLTSLNDPNLTFQYADTNATLTVYVSYNLGISYDTLLSENTDDGWRTGNYKLDATKEHATLKFRGHNAKWTGSSCKIYLDTISVDETPADPIFTISHTEHDFATVILTENEQLQIEITNTGGQSITIDDVRLEGANSSDFSFENITLPTVITSNVLSIDLSFDPLTEGNKEATLVIEENDGTLHNVTLTGVAFDSEIKELPFIENFDAVSVGEIPLGWKTLINSSSSSAYVEVYNNSLANSAPNELRIYGGKAEGDVISILPYTNLDLTNARLKFEGRGSSGCSIIVGTLSDPTDLTTFIEVDTVYPNSALSTTYDADLSAISETENYHIGLKHGNPNSFSIIYIDDIRITDNGTPEITSSPETEIHVGEVYTYNITAIDAENDALTFTLEYATDWLTLIDNGDGTAVLSGTPESTGYKPIKVVVSDDEDESFQSYTLTVTNTKAVVSSTPVTEIHLGNEYLYNLVASDADNDALSISLTEGPTWMSLTDNGDGTATVSGTPDKIAAHTVKIAVSDGYESVNHQYVIEVTNQAPEFVSVPLTTAIVTQSYFYQVSATDLDNDELEIIDEETPSWLTLSETVDGYADLSGVPTLVGNYNVSLKVTDGIDSVAQMFTIVVADTNARPWIISDPLTEVFEDSAYMYVVVASDYNEDAISIFASEKPDWLTLVDNGDGTANLSGTTSIEGDYNVLLSVTDGVDTTHQEFVLTVIDNQEAPEFVTLPLYKLMAGEAYVYEVGATDANGETLSLFAETKPDWLTFSDNEDGTGLLSGTAAEDGFYSVVLGATDGIDTSYQQFEIEVTAEPNNIPEFTSIPVTEGVEESVYSYEITAADLDESDVLTFGATVKPEWLTFTDNGDRTATLTGTPMLAGTYNVTITVTDGAEFPTQEFQIVVAPKPNVEPVFTSSPITEGVEENVYTYNVVVNDDDTDDVITITAPTKPDWLTITDNGDRTAVLSGTPMLAGSYEVVVNVHDGEAHVIQEFTIVVAAKPNIAPVFVSTPITEGIAESVYTYAIEVNDEDANDILTITATTIPDWLTITDNGDRTAILSGTPISADSFDVVLNVNDGEANVTQEFTIVIEPKPYTGPEFVSVPIEEVHEGSVYAYNIQVNDVDDTNITITIIEKPEWLTLSDNGNGTALLTGKAMSEGVYDVVLNATDGEYDVQQEFAITVIANEAPVFTSTPQENGKVGQEYIYAISATDADTVIFGVQEIPDWLTQTKATAYGLLSGVPAVAGTFEITIFATDQIDTTYQSWSIVVDPVDNHAPVIETQPITEAKVDSLYIYRISASDPDSEDEVVYGYEYLPEWLSLGTYDDGTAAVYGTPSDAGTYEVAIFATDGKDTVRQEYTITSIEINVAPEISSVPDTIGKVNETYTYQMVVSDANNDEIIISATNLPEWLSLSDNGDGTAILTGIPEFADIYNVSLTATDGEFSVEQIFSINVLPTNINAHVLAEISMYPNPVSDLLHIKFEGSFHVQLINIMGEIIYNKLNCDNRHQIPVHEFKAGHYFVKISWDDQMYIQKVVVE